MHHQGGATQGEQDGPLHQPYRADCAERQRGCGGRMASTARAVAEPGGDSLHTADHPIDCSTADSACRCGCRIGGLRHSANGTLENVHLFTSTYQGLRQSSASVHLHVNLFARGVRRHRSKLRLGVFAARGAFFMRAVTVR